MHPSQFETAEENQLSRVSFFLIFSYKSGAEFHKYTFLFSFPVSYNDRFYLDVLDSGELAKLAYYNDIAVGAACCRIDVANQQRRLYIMTLGCLEPYRRLGIGTVMLNHILKYVEESDGNFDNIFL